VRRVTPLMASLPGAAEGVRFGPVPAIPALLLPHAPKANSSPNPTLYVRTSRNILITKAAAGYISPRNAARDHFRRSCTMNSSGAVANGIGEPARRKEDFRLFLGRKAGRSARKKEVLE
jgi:hypothetical protein